MHPVGLVSLRAGDLLYEQGDHNTDAFVVASGEVMMFRSERGKRIDCERRGRGSVLGGLSVLTNQSRYVGAQAMTDAVVFRVASHHVINELDAVSPMLRACIDTAITFNARLSQALLEQPETVPKAEAEVADTEALIERYKFEIDLLRSISKNELSMAYQPIVTLQSGEIVGFEALMRWVHPERGYVPPDKFIAVAEDLGVVGSLTNFAIEETLKTLKQISKSQDGQEPFFASINISGHDVARPGFATHVATLLDQFDVDPSQIKLEVTETAFIPDNEDVLENLHSLESLGCSLSIDDFGTGYSNLAHLKIMPVSTLKIDRAFAGDAHCNRVSGSIVAMLVGLGTALDVDIVAEGVETQEDVEALSGLGCTLGQGYHFHRPTGEQNLLHLLHAGSDRASLESVA